MIDDNRYSTAALVAVQHVLIGVLSRRLQPLETAENPAQEIYDACETEIKQSIAQGASYQTEIAWVEECLEILAKLLRNETVQASHKNPFI